MNMIAVRQKRGSPRKELHGLRNGTRSIHVTQGLDSRAAGAMQGVAQSRRAVHVIKACA